MSGDQRRRVAIACQGGGSHTAFTAGVLAELLGSAELEGHEVVGISGTSGGAICALLAWNALRRGDPAAAAPLLEGFWADNAAATPTEALANAGALWVGTLQNLGLVPFLSPYDLPVDGSAEFRRLLERWIDLDGLDVDEGGLLPLLLIGAVDVLSGRFVAFNSRRDRITVDTVLASAAIPTLFRAVSIGDGAYWDGLFSQNPPVRDLLDVRPDEIWVVQINPTRTDRIPRTVLDIADRRNELSGNLSLYQELRAVEKIDQLLAEGLLAATGRYRHVTVRVVSLARSRATRLLGPVSKLNLDPRFIADLIAQGRQQAGEFLTALRFETAWRESDVDAVLGFLADDAELELAGPFPPAEGLAGGAAHGAVRELLTRELQLDLTRKQVAQEAVTWTVRAAGAGPEGLGQVAAAFRDGKVRRLVVGPQSP